MIAYSVSQGPEACHRRHGPPRLLPRTALEAKLLLYHESLLLVEYAVWVGRYDRQHQRLTEEHQALRIVEMRRKLARKEDGAVNYADQSHLEALVRACLDKQEKALEDLTLGPSETEP